MSSDKSWLRVIATDERSDCCIGSWFLNDIPCLDQCALECLLLDAQGVGNVPLQREWSPWIAALLLKW